MIHSGCQRIQVRSQHLGVDNYNTDTDARDHHHRLCSQRDKATIGALAPPQVAVSQPRTAGKTAPLGGVGPR